jgi:hypothetical protein
VGVNSGPFTASLASWADKVWPTIVGHFRRAVLARKRRLPSILPQPRLPQPIRDLLWFVLIGAVVGAVYGHMIAISDGAPRAASRLLELSELRRGRAIEGVSDGCRSRITCEVEVRLAQRWLGHRRQCAPDTQQA